MEKADAWSPRSAATTASPAASLQWAALRQLGVEAELLDATPAVRNPLFRVPHNLGSAYIFHADGPQSAALLAAVRERYDLVVLDTPPVLPMADALVLAQHADATLMVVRWEKTARAPRCRTRCGAAV